MPVNRTTLPLPLAVPGRLCEWSRCGVGRLAIISQTLHAWKIYRSRETCHCDQWGFNITFFLYLFVRSLSLMNNVPEKLFQRAYFCQAVPKVGPLATSTSSSSSLLQADLLMMISEFYWFLAQLTKAKVHVDSVSPGKEPDLVCGRAWLPKSPTSTLQKSKEGRSRQIIMC